MDIFAWHVETYFMAGFPVSWNLLFVLALAAHFTARVATAQAVVRFVLSATEARHPLCGHTSVCRKA